jgi:ElaB/YqjD/DUF883 family membrane-anchored ribosome-binding protein
MKDHEKSISVIEQDMARARAEIGRTAEALEAKIEPENLADAARQVILESTQRVEDKVKELADHAGGRAENLGEQAAEYIHQNPLPALIAGVGLGLLIWLAERQVNTLHTVEPRGGGGHGILANHPEMMQAQRKSVRQARRMNTNHPVLLAAAALGAGLLLGSLLPATRKEDELLGPTRDRLLETGKEGAQQALDQAKGMMGQELEKRKAEASELAQTAEEAAMTAFNQARAEGEE